MARFLLPWFVAAAALAQTPAGPQLEFEAASIKPNTGVTKAVELGFPSPGTFHARNVWLRFLIQNAWQVKDYQVIGGPAWASSDRYDIEARTTGHPSRDEMWSMVRALLRDRFHLIVRSETRELPIYELIRASPDKGKLSESNGGDCEPRPVEPQAAPPAKPYCGSSAFSPRSLDGTAISMAQFVGMLANIVQRPVVDKTGDTFAFNAHLSWIPDQTTPGLLAPGVASPPIPEGADAGPTLFNALRDTLGLKLVSSKGPVDTLVVEHAEKPSGN